MKYKALLKYYDHKPSLIHYDHKPSLIHYDHNLYPGAITIWSKYNTMLTY